MDVIYLKSYLMRKFEYALLPVLGISVAIVFATLNISIIDRWIVSVFLVIAEMRLMYFLNRFEPKFIALDGERFEISYQNYRYFEKPDRTCIKSETNILNKGEMLLLSDNDGVIGKIRKKAVSAEDWTTLENYFS